ncbi:MAG: hypothetical protein JO307_21605 [Bryobacterales bacterium]|nr:hypothetical protein [Bryobacterales bacterium]MBV9397162.1 hypothetical protein [Bryobacterales bacterium]
MKLKSYFSGTVEAAMEMARKELGDEALLVNARPATPETRYLGDYEVVFGVNDNPPAQPAAPPSGDRLALEVAELKREFERITESLRESLPSRQLAERPVEAPVSPATRPEGFHARLVAQDLDPALIESVLEGAALEDKFETDATLGAAGANCRIVVFIGPPGAGKTTALVKLAARFGLASHGRAQILSADVHRIAAAAQLQTLSSILGIGCAIAETAADLAESIQRHASKELILIDTPGLTRSEMEDAEDLIQLLQSRPDLDAHLVLPAFLRPPDMSRAIELYSCFAPKKLLFTRMDETSQYGPLVSQSAQWSLPISFLCNGQQIPDDIEPATCEKLAQMIHGGQVQRAAVLARGAAA